MIIRFLILMALGAYLFHVQATIPFQTDDDLFDVIKFSKIPTLTNPDGYRNKKSASTVRFSDLSESTDLSSSVATDSVQKCKTVKNSIHVSKEDRSSTGETLRVCEGVIQVNKCEGVCLSNLRPSVNTATGLVKVVLRSQLITNRNNHIKTNHINFHLFYYSHRIVFVAENECFTVKRLPSRFVSTIWEQEFPAQ